MDTQDLRTELLFTLDFHDLPTDTPPIQFSICKTHIDSPSSPEKLVYRQEPFQTGIQFSDIDFQMDFSEKYRLEVSFDDNSIAFATVMGRDLGRISRLEVQLVRNESPAGRVEVGTNTSHTSETVYLKFRGVNLKDLDTWSKSDPYFQIKVPFQGSDSVLHKSEVVPDNLDPLWRGFFLPKAYLHRDSRDVPFRVEVHDDDVGNSDMIGVCVTTLTELLTPNTTLVLHRSSDGSGPVTGRIQVDKAFSCPTKTFIDYLRSGVEFNMTVAVDFSAKNRPQTDAKSLHSLTSDSNSYLSALKSLSEFFKHFDSTGHCDVYGFGAKVGGSDYISHCFPVASNVCGSEGAEQAYREILGSVEFASPCYLHKIIQQLLVPYERRSVPMSSSSLVYNIVVILTQGDLEDLEEFKEQLVRASSLPFSVVIVSMGATMFPHLTTADSDLSLMKTAAGHFEDRNFVHRLLYSHFLGNPRSFLHQAFSQIPRQLQEFMMGNKLV